VTDDQWNQLKPLAEANAAAQQALRNCGQSNRQSDPRKALEQDVLMARLQLEAQQAQRALDDATRAVLGVV
jgi:hypothetical protein